MSTSYPLLCFCRGLALACGLSALLVGCGYKGPLYMPPPPDTLGNEAQTTQMPESAEPTEPPNPSLEPAPIIIE